MLIGLKPGTALSLGPLAAVLSKYGATVIGGKSLSVIGIIEVSIPKDAAVPSFIADAEATGLVRFAERHRIYVMDPPLILPNDPALVANGGNEWHPATINCPTAWQLLHDNVGAGSEFGASTVKLANLDTGYTSPSGFDEIPNLLTGYNAVTETTGNTSDVDCASGHGGDGTLTSNVMCAATNNSQGIAGIAAGCSFMPIVIWEELITACDGHIVSSDTFMANGLIYAANNGIRAASLTIAGGSTPSSSTLTAALQYAWGQGVFIAGVPGDAGATTLTYPGSNALMLDTSATTNTDTHPSYSTANSTIALSAPGGGLIIPSQTMTTIDRTGSVTANFAGTSFAGPILTAVAGLCLTANPNLNNTDLAALLMNATTLVSGSTGWNAQFGVGRIDAGKAVTAAIASLTGNVQRNADTLLGMD